MHDACGGLLASWEHPPLEQERCYAVSWEHPLLEQERHDAEPQENTGDIGSTIGAEK